MKGFCRRYISRESAAFGKSHGDKQYFYLNGRPVNLPKAGSFWQMLVWLVSNDKNAEGDYHRA
jgi:DNA mismatch repair ATPase MutL